MLDLWDLVSAGVEYRGQESQDGFSEALRGDLAAGLSSLIFLFPSHEHSGYFWSCRMSRSWSRPPLCEPRSDDPPILHTEGRRTWKHFDVTHRKIFYHKGARPVGIVCAWLGILQGNKVPQVAGLNNIKGSISAPFSSEDHQQMPLTLGTGFIDHLHTGHSGAELK